MAKQQKINPFFKKISNLFSFGVLFSTIIHIFPKRGNNIPGDFMIKVILRTVIMYFFVILSVRLMGKRQIGDMQPTELVITLLISEIAAIPLQDFSQPVSLGIVAIFVLVFLEILTSVMIMKNLRLRRLFSGKAVMVIKDGKIDQKAMKSIRMTVFDLIEMLRIQGVFSLDDVDTAVLEVNGNLSVCVKEKNQPPTAEKLSIIAEEKGISMPVISDGLIIDSSLNFLGKSRSWFLGLLKSMQVSASDIFVMTLNRKGDMTVVKKENQI